MKVRNFIGGKWVDAASGNTSHSVNPADTREVVAEVSSSRYEDVDHAVVAAREAFSTWRTLPPPRRGEILFRVGELLLKEKQNLGELVTREMGKVLTEGLGDVQEAIDMAFYMAGEGRRMVGETVPSELSDKDCKSFREPVGVIALITPWNFPTAIPAWKIFPALICGNTVVFKPSSDTPACAAALIGILEKAGVPVGVVNMVCGAGAEVGEYLASHKGVDAVSFTGSSAVGERLEGLLGKMHRPLATEMGGKNAIVIMDDADLSLALEGVLWGAFGTSGQRCTAASRLIIHQKVYDQFVEMLVRSAAKLKLGNGLLPATQVGPIINERQFSRILDYVRIGKEEGATLASGGRPAAEGYGHGFFMEPTVFAHVTPTMRIAQEEIFGPVVCALRCSDLDEAIGIANNVSYGLSSAIYSRNVNSTARAEHDLQTGIVYVNASTIGAEIHLPFGGWRHSGSGHPEAGGRGGAIDFYSRIKVVYRDFSGRLQKAQIDK